MPTTKTKKVRHAVIATVDQRGRMEQTHIPFSNKDELAEKLCDEFHEVYEKSRLFHKRGWMKRTGVGDQRQYDETCELKKLDYDGIIDTVMGWQWVDDESWFTDRSWIIIE